MALDLYRQGDVLLEKAVIKKSIRKKSGKIVLVHGVSTNHDHAFQANAKDQEEDGKRFVSITKKEPLTHQEHSHLTVDIGTYEVVRQCEYWGDTIKEVVD